MQRKKCFSKNPYIMKFLQTGESGNRWEQAGKCTAGTQLECEGVRRQQKPWAAADSEDTMRIYIWKV